MEGSSFKGVLMAWEQVKIEGPVVWRSGGLVKNGDTFLTKDFISRTDFRARYYYSNGNHILLNLETREESKLYNGQMIDTSK